MYLSLVGLTKKDICGKSQPQPLDINIDLFPPFPRSMIHSFWDYINIIIIHYKLHDDVPSEKW